MKLGINQPYFLPYIGYFCLINLVDEFILFDTVQFERHSWIERNRILKPNGVWQYISVPLIKSKQNTPIKDMKINNEIKWQNRLLAQLVHYQKKAPYYKNIINLLSSIIYNYYDNITDLDRDLLITICNYLEINTPILKLSNLNININEVKAPDEWALNICLAYGADSYINLPGGITFFNKDKYENSGIKLNFLKLKEIIYSQKNNIFIPNLSIIDLMMFNDVPTIKNYLNQYDLI